MGKKTARPACSWRWIPRRPFQGVEGSGGSITAACFPLLNYGCRKRDAQD
jgi:hypothetical protein